MESQASAESGPGPVCANLMESHGALSCVICFEGLEKRFQLENCVHGHFHEQCIMEWVQRGGQNMSDMQSHNSVSRNRSPPI